MANSSPFKGLFDLQTPRDLLQKLEYDFQRLMQSPCDQYAAFDFFLTARHMPDLLYPGPRGSENEKNRLQCEKDSALLRVCAHIADGAKHFHATAKKHRSVQQSVVQEGAFQSDAFQADAFQVNALIIRLEAKSAEALGCDEIESADLAARILKYWNDYLGQKATNNQGPNDSVRDNKDDASVPWRRGSVTDE